MRYLRLNDGYQIPVLGYGIYQISNQEVERCVYDAIQVGYRHIDTAQGYKNELGVGNGIKQSGINRDELFITTKVWVDNFGYEKTKQSLDESLKRLQTNYIDLVLIHHPFSDYYGAYKTLEEYRKDGKIRSIGVSNFSIDRLVDIGEFNYVKPAVNQIEVNPFYQRLDEIKENQEYNNLQVEAWAPFMEGQHDIFNNPILKKIADNHNKTTAQVILNYLVNLNLIVLAKTSKKERMIENFNVLDFDLTKEEQQLIRSLDKNESSFFYDNTKEGVYRMEKVILERRKKF